MPVSPIHRLAGPTGLALLFSLGLCNLASLSALGADDTLTDAAPRGTPSPDTASPDAAVPDFNRDIRPLLSDNCYACHGFDQRAREADLRLDTFEGATQDLGGYAAIVPGKSEESELIARITASDSDELMPPADSHRKPLSPQSIELLRRWIDQGARWGRHWSFVPPRKADVPRGEHPVDYFVRQRLASQSRQLAPAAQPHTLIRRLALDLTGLPPSAEQTESFLRQPSETAWKHSVDQLLNSPHYGERLAMWWLDGARYSDTDGFQQDAERTNWPWRDWVVDAFNANMPFDQFTIEQFAGDLLPQASDAQKLATCFHRNHMNNGEGGRDPEESRVDYVLDRVNTAGTLWLGLTLGCTQCHDHKFDPISQRDYYSFSAYFNSIDETGKAGSGAGPYLTWKSPVAERGVRENELMLQQLEQEIAAQKAVAEPPFEAWLAERVDGLRAEPFQPWAAAPIDQLTSTEGYRLSSDDGRTVVASPSPLPQDDYRITTHMPPGMARITAVRLTVLPHADHTAGKLSHSPSGEFILTNFKLRLRRRGSSQYRQLDIVGAVADVEGQGKDAKYAGIAGTLDDDPRTGWTTREHAGDQPHWAVFELSEPLVIAADEALDVILMQRSIENRELIGRFQLAFSDQRGQGIRSREPMPLEQLSALLTGSPAAGLDDIPAPLRQQLWEQFLEDDPALQALEQRRRILRQQLEDARKAAGELRVMVLQERQEPRPTFVLDRGDWQSHAEEVQPGVLPAVLAMDSSQVPTRLELGRWMVHRDNPLTARVIVNQIWQLLFGAGLVRTANDFGLQGEMPTHPQLLDWLAVDFMDSGWDLKHLLRTIVTSDTYRQTSEVSPELLALDPHNRWLARGARFRLPAWMIRDTRLALSGQLRRELGGPPVYPYQPPGVWKDQFMGRLSYQPTMGSGQYRRTLYAFWRRTSAPTFLFDSAMRRSCEVTVQRTNTPLHALTLLNDLTGQEVARTLADRFALDPQLPSVDDQLHALWRHALGREASSQEAELLSTQYNQALAFYAQHAADAGELLSVGQLAPPSEERLAERAALMVVATLVLNLDEAITHE